ncbi:HAD hydrolase family protein [Thermus scotoductus]|uniref:HAD hydrolase family protein n=1 Tax=Thermus scotoductus TaxID=37636 RepID=UPI003F511644
MRFVSLTKRGVSKLSAARFVAESYGLTLAQCAMVGDGENARTTAPDSNTWRPMGSSLRA